MSLSQTYRFALVAALATLVTAALAGVASAQVVMPAPQTAATSQIGNGEPMEGFNAPAQEKQGRIIQQKTNLAIGRSVTVDLPGDARDVIVTNPAIVQAIMRGQRRLVIVGLADGTTDVTALSESGLTIANVRVLVSRDLDRLSLVLREVLPTAIINLRAVGSAVLITGEVDNAGQAAQVETLARAFLGNGGENGGGSQLGGAGGAGGAGPMAPAGGLGGQGGNSNVINALSIRGRDQVMLRVTVAEVQRNVLKQLGINSYGNWEIGNFAMNAATSAAFPVAGRFLGNGALGGSSSPLNADGSLDRAKGKGLSLQALEQASVARILAEPNLTAVSGERAEFLVGGEVPIPTGAAQSQGTSNNTNVQPTIEFKKFGVSLSFTPIVLDRGRISLNVGTEVSEVDTTQGTSIPTASGKEIQIPGFRVRKQSTTIEMPSGSSLVTAGLIQSTTRQAINGFPGLMNLPVLGALFRSRDYQRLETELMIIVTPYIAKPTPPKALAKPTDGLRDASDVNAIVLGQINKVDPTDPLAKAAIAPKGPVPSNTRPYYAEPVRKGRNPAAVAAKAVEPQERKQPRLPPFVMN